jgi:hypothetical protein
MCYIFLPHSKGTLFEFVSLYNLYLDQSEIFQNLFKDNYPYEQFRFYLLTKCMAVFSFFCFLTLVILYYFFMVNIFWNFRNDDISLINFVI